MSGRVSAGPEARVELARCGDIAWTVGEIGVLDKQYLDPAASNWRQVQIFDMEDRCSHDKR